MLRGRESLVRLVGKRRRFLPNRDSLLSNSVQSRLQACTDRDERTGSIESSEGSAMAEGGRLEERQCCGESEEVSCPVCGHKIRGTNYTLNTHLDMCLSSGAKRKLTQRTLLEMNFCSPSKVQCVSPKRLQFGLTDCNGSIEENVITGLTDFKGLERNSDCLFKSSPCLIPVSENGTDDTYKNLTQDESASDYCIPSSLCIISEVLDSDVSRTSTSLCIKSEVIDGDVPQTFDDIFGVQLKTFIIGRKFVNEKEIKDGESILLVRDPHNVKDPNAVQVVSTSSQDLEVLGFIPRKLAQYLSPLIQNYCLRFEGRVTAVPKTSHESVPIQIFCLNTLSDENNENDNIELFQSLWTNVQKVIESSKNGQSSAIKYQQNFSILVREVLGSNRHLFINEERDFIESFNSFSDDSQRLFVRLYTRKGPWFRMSNIFYPEISDPQNAINQVSETGYIRCFEGANELQRGNISDILNLLTVAELREIIGVLKLRCNGVTRKQDLINFLLSSYQDGFCPLLPNKILEKTGACVRISSKAESLFWRAERLFFLNGDQDLSSFLLADLGIIKYPTYNCLITEPIFADRNDLLAYEEAIEVAQMIDQALEENESECVLQCIKIAESCISRSPTKAMEPSATEPSVTFLSCFSASFVYSKVILLGASFLERERRYNEAILLLKRLLESFTCSSRRGYWILRLSVDLEHIGCVDESLSVAESGLQDSWVRAGSRMALQRRVLRLAKPPRRWKIPSFAPSVKRKIKEVHVQGRSLNCVTGVKSRFYGEDGEQCGVEQLALQYYAGEGGEWHGVHSETGIWLTIFGLVMWDLLFSDLPNVFRTKFQTAPLDLDTDSFYLSRKSKIECHLQKIYDGMAEEIVITSWERHNGTACRGVNWNRHSLCDLRAAVACIGGPCLASLCRHLAQDYRSWSSGMPDLFLWRFDGRFGGEAKLVEVKGPKDRLSEQQRAWLLLLMDCGFNAEVCKVSPQPA